MRKAVVKKTAIRKKTNTKKKTSFWNRNATRFLLSVFGLLFLIAIAYHYRNGFAYYLGFKSNKANSKHSEKGLSDVRNFQLLNKYADKVAGIDVSHYQGTINWKEVKYVENTFLIQFAFVRATIGKDKRDVQFESNWLGTKKNKIIRGAYHYYRPNENSLLQAKNFIETVQLQSGDLPPILDIEKLPKNQSLDSLKVGLRRWLKKVDSHYNIKPIIYTSEKYYNDFLKEEFSDYSFWIANYNFFVEEMQDDWLFWQFTEKATIPGIKSNVDVNLYNGTPKMLRYLTVN